LVHLCSFNYTRGDPVRSLFMFAQQDKPIGSAINWLEIVVANAYGAKGTWPDRHRWVAENQPLIKAVAADPGRIWEANITAKERFAFAAACIEYVAADHCGAEYRTHLPVWLDASSNGLQHLAMIRRDKELAGWVNVDRGEFNVNYFECDGQIVRAVPDREARIVDVYQIIVERVRLSLQADRHDPAARLWLQRNDLRDLLKQPVMTLPYGAGSWGMFEQIADACEDLRIAADAKAIAKLRDHVFEAIKELLPRTIETMGHIQGIADRCLARGSFMRWTSPSGFPVCNRYLKSRAPRVWLPFAGQKLTIADGHTAQPRRRKVHDAAVANVVHSMEASHLIRSTNAAVGARITNIMSIHDCYATTAPDTDEFKNIRRGELGGMYHEYDVLEHLRENDPGTEPIELGELNPVAAAFSEYLDR